MKDFWGKLPADSSLGLKVDPHLSLLLIFFFKKLKAIERTDDLNSSSSKTDVTNVDLSKVYGGLFEGDGIKFISFYVIGAESYRNSGV